VENKRVHSEEDKQTQNRDEFKGRQKNSKQCGCILRGCILINAMVSEKHNPQVKMEVDLADLKKKWS
jgi:hypothetical protein